MSEDFLHGTVHQAPDDMRGVIEAEAALFDLWQKLTPLGRNEFICWVEDAKQPKTRERRIQRTSEELLGCIHRTDKAPSKWQQDVLIDKKKR